MLRVIYAIQTSGKTASLDALFKRDEKTRLPCVKWNECFVWDTDELFNFFLNEYNSLIGQVYLRKALDNALKPLVESLVLTFLNLLEKDDHFHIIVTDLVVNFKHVGKFVRLQDDLIWELNRRNKEDGQEFDWIRSFPKYESDVDNSVILLRRGIYLTQTLLLNFLQRARVDMDNSKFEMFNSNRRIHMFIDGNKDRLTPDFCGEFLLIEPLDIVFDHLRTYRVNIDDEVLKSMCVREEDWMLPRIPPVVNFVDVNRRAILQEFYDRHVMEMIPLYRVCFFKVFKHKPFGNISINHRVLKDGSERFTEYTSSKIILDYNDQILRSLKNEVRLTKLDEWMVDAYNKIWLDKAPPSGS